MTKAMPRARKDWCPGRDLNPYATFEAADFKSAASTNFATRASNAAPKGRIKKQLLWGG